MPHFRAKARAVDLLGKGQIADLPTAICELWKNGYDAYADKMSCDLYLEGYKDINSPVFTVSDDGTGMSLDDIHNKWIVLGTDSKARDSEYLPKEDRLGKPLRTPMGEKGIGRLSVAYLGPQMLMFSKKKDMNCQVLLLHWRILENYNLFLDDVNIPIEELKSLSDLQLILGKLLKDFNENLSTGNWTEHKQLADEISKDIKNWCFQDDLAKDVISKLLIKNNHGTIFVIFKPHEQIIEITGKDYIEISKTDEPAIKYLRSSLCGINNAYKDERFFETSFWIHDSVDNRYDLIAKGNFFTKEDIDEADHWFRGKFNKKGKFTGEICVYNQILKHEFQPSRPPGKTPYGPFKIEFGFIEGDPFNSKLPREKWGIIKKKCDALGGLYIYRDGFRVLPYGRTEYDFLRFEERRSLSATYYAFSHRRIFGYIEITRNNNKALKDKAGREGFIENRAYREFQKDLIEFFVDLSIRYLRSRTTSEKDKGDVPSLREEQIIEIRKHNKRIISLEKKRNKMSTARFRRELKANFEFIGEMSEEIIILREKLAEEEKRLSLVYNNISSLIIEIEEKKKLFRKMKMLLSKRFNLTKGQTNKYYDYVDKYEELSSVFSQCDDLISGIHERLSQENLQREFNKRYDEFKNDVTEVVKNYESRFLGTIDDLSTDIKKDVQVYSDMFKDQSRHLLLTGDEDKTEVRSRISTLEGIYRAIREEIENKYDSFIRHIEGMTFGIDDDFLVGWYKQQYEKIKERVEAFYELAQLGMAIEIIDHQFNVLYSEMSAAISFFKDFSEENPKVQNHYRQLRQAFEHLETNHQLLTPLYRTMRRSKTTITGLDIKMYLKQFFRKRFERHNIDFHTTDSFDAYEFYTYESVIKPVFINLINNAIYWLITAAKREILMTYENGNILILNSGKRIDHTDLKWIFNLFTTRKPGGRGIGLYLARTNLHTIGYDIFATNDKKVNRLKGACFIINKYAKESE